MNSLIVVMGSSVVRGLQSEYIPQLQAAKIPYHIKTLPALIPNGNYGSLALKIEGIKQWAKDFAGYEKIIISDAWDMMFFGTKEEVYEKIGGDWPILAAEKTSFPKQVAPKDKWSGVMKYVNGGWMAGSPSALMNWCREIENHPRYASARSEIDQKFFNSLLEEGPEWMRLDHKAEIVFNAGAGTVETHIVGVSGRPYNKVDGTYPNFCHFSGRTSTRSFRTKLTGIDPGQRSNRPYRYAKDGLTVDWNETFGRANCLEP